MAFKVGQYVHHTKYGNGIITELAEDRTKVDFDTAGIRMFVTSMATFEAAEGEAPKKKRTVRKTVKAQVPADVGTPVVMS